MIQKEKKRLPLFPESKKSNYGLSKSFIANLFSSRRNSQKPESRFSVSTNRSALESKPRITSKTPSNRYNCTKVSSELQKRKNKTFISEPHNFLNNSQLKNENIEDNFSKTEQKETKIDSLKNQNSIIEAERVKSDSEYLEIQEIKRKLYFQEIKAYNLLTETNRLRNENSDFEIAFNEIRSQKESLARKIEEDFFTSKMQQMEISRLKSELSHQNLQSTFLKNTLEEERKNNMQLKFELREKEIENEFLKHRSRDKDLEMSTLAEEVVEYKKEISKLKMIQKNKFIALMKKPSES